MSYGSNSTAKKAHRDPNTGMKTNVGVRVIAHSFEEIEIPVNDERPDGGAMVNSVNTGFNVESGDEINVQFQIFQVPNALSVETVLSDNSQTPIASSNGMVSDATTVNPYVYKAKITVLNEGQLQYSVTNSAQSGDHWSLQIIVRRPVLNPRLTSVGGGYP